MAKGLRDRGESLDQLDSEFVDETVRTRGYAIIETRIDAVMKDKIQELTQDLDAIATAKCRGFLEGLRRAKEIPGVIIREGRN